MTDSLRIEATLLETGIRRVIQLDGAMTLAAVHDVLQTVFGWEDRHLHEFSDDEVSTSASLRWLDAEGLAEGFDGLPETEWSIASAFGASGGVLHYLYDFGDNWTHRLELLATRPALDGEPMARVVAGELGAALEDSGGSSGYATAVEAWGDPTHPLREYALSAPGPWRRFDPQLFDIDTVNDELAELDPVTAPTPMMPRLVADLDEGGARAFRRYIAPVRRGPAPEPAEMARFLHPYLWFIGRIGEAGVPVTDAGWLQPAFVREVMDELGWAVRYPATVRSESSTPPVRRMKENLRQLGLVRKYRGRLLPQAKTAEIVATPERLWAYLAAAIGRLGVPAEVDATLLYAAEIALGGDGTGRDERVAFGLGALGWQLRGEEWPSEADAAELTTTVRRIFAELGEPRRPGSAVVATPIQRAFARAIVLAAP
ncbi:plasmid pRiA4b ORF-3 family protein [Microbacteriaceae bacterium VKM Ac-2854]|nr:plasmid pRiA4b ORF-3 family protein [Microbacteriaceae bacterium VKM Ac-2854]